MEPSETQPAPRTRKRWLYHPQARCTGWTFNVEGLRQSSLAILFLVLVENVLERTYFPQLRLPFGAIQPRWLELIPRLVQVLMFVGLFAFAANWGNGLMAPDPRRTWRRLDPGHFLDPIGIALFAVALLVAFRWGQ